jgi:hypothetical protein
VREVGIPGDVSDFRFVSRPSEAKHRKMWRQCNVHTLRNTKQATLDQKPKVHCSIRFMLRSARLIALLGTFSGESRPGTPGLSPPETVAPSSQ